MTTTTNESSTRGRARGTRARVRARSIAGAAATLAAVAAVIASTQAIAGARAGESRPTAAAAPRVSVTPAAFVDSYTVRQTYTGRARPRRTASLAFEAAGRIAAVHVDEGDRVREGQVLATQDGRRLEKRRGVLEARRARARARLDELVAGPLPQQIEAVRAGAESVAAELRQAEAERERAEGLVAKGVRPASAAQGARAREEALAASLRQSRQRLEELSLGTRRERIRAQKAELAEIEAEIGLLDHDVASASVRAPFAGVVTRRHLDEGAVAGPRDAVFEIMTVDAMEVSVGVPVAVARSLTAGDETTIEFDGEQAGAEVAAILPEVDPRTRTCSVIFRVLDGGGAVPRAGQQGRVELVRQVEERGCWLSTSALTKAAKGLWSCLVVVPGAAGDRVEERPVEIIHTTGSRALVRGSLEPGELVIGDGAHRVIAGQTVRGVEGP